MTRSHSYSLKSIFILTAAIGCGLCVVQSVRKALTCYGGRFDNSPNGQYRAEGMVFGDSSENWFELKLTEIPSNKLLWQQRRTYRYGIDSGPGYNQGLGPDHCIRWSRDSKFVSFQIENDDRIEVELRQNSEGSIYAQLAPSPETISPIFQVDKP